MDPTDIERVMGSLHSLHGKVDRMDAVLAALTQFQTDLTTTLTDLEAEVHAIPAPDPASKQAALDLISKLSGQVKTADPGAQAMPTPDPVPPAPVLVNELPVYTTTNPEPIDTAVWPDSGETVPNTTPPEKLYHYSLDTPGAPPAGGTIPGWTVYTGPEVEPAVA